MFLLRKNLLSYTRLNKQKGVVMKVVIDEFIKKENTFIKLLNEQIEYDMSENARNSMLKAIEYHESLAVILDIFKLLCCMVVDKLDYHNINENEIISLIEETRIREIEKGSDA